MNVARKKNRHLRAAFGLRAERRWNKKKRDDEETEDRALFYAKV
jgi:hypothetical protein